MEDGFPRVVLRERPHLVKTFTYEFRQPYHTAEKKPSFQEARAFIAGVRTEARGLAYRMVHTARVNLEKQDYELERCALIAASGRPLPDLERILASHALIHTADGELFREALLHACAKDGLATYTIKENELIERARRALDMTAPELAARIADAGRPFGSPWAQDEKFAALVACLSLLESSATAVAGGKGSTRKP